MVAYTFPAMPIGLLLLFLRVYYRLPDMHLRIAFWFAYKGLSFLVVSLWAKMVCYAVRHDVQSLLVLFMTVRGGDGGEWWW